MCHASFNPVSCGIIFSHFENDDAPNSNRQYYGNFWKLRRVSDYLNTKFAGVHNLTEQLATDRKIQGRNSFPPVLSKEKGNVLDKVIQIV
jgi:hypothetical protein